MRQLACASFLWCLAAATARRSQAPDREDMQQYAHEHNQPQGVPAGEVLLARQQFRPCSIASLAMEPTAQDFNYSMHDVRFIHIPKTGGTSVEMFARSMGVHWGHLRGRPMPEEPPNNDTACECTFHHRPPQCMSNYLNQKVTFAVVRHPTFRFVSEFCWRASRKRYHWTAEEIVLKMHEMIDDMPHTHRRTYDCHLLPQIEYAKSADFLLYFEELQEDFGCFTSLLFRQEHQLPRSNPSSSLCTSISYRNLSAESLKKLEDFYAEDFQQFGYRRLSTSLGQ